MPDEDYYDRGFMGDEETQLNPKDHITADAEVDDVFQQADAEESEDSYSSDDDNAELLTPAVEKKWWETFGMLKSRDPKVYEADANFFDTDEFMEESEAVEDDADVNFIKAQLSYNEQQDAIKKSFLAAAGDAEGDDDDDFVKIKHKTAEELEKEEAKYRKFLKGEEASCGDAENVLSGLKEQWNKDDLSEEDKFLKDYFLNKRWEGEDGYINVPHPGQKVFQDYRFRFEEPDTEFIKSYPAKIEGSLRSKKTSNAARKRVKKQERVDAVKKLDKQDQAVRYKLLQSISDKIITGKGSKKAKIPPSFLEDDFDPLAHEKVMKEMFQDDVVDESDLVDGPDTLEKPTFEFDEDIDGPMLEEAPKDYGEEYMEGWDQETGQDVEGEIIEGPRRPKKSRHKKHSKSKLTQAKASLGLQDEKSGTEASKSMSDYLESYYEVAARRLLGEDECRFPYRKVQGDNYGLTTEEILIAPDEELDAWHDVSEVSHYLTQEEEDVARQRYQAKPETLLTKKRTIIPSLFQPDASEREDQRKHSDGEYNSKEEGQVSKKIQELLEKQDNLAAMPVKLPKKKSKLLVEKEIKRHGTVKGVPMSRLKAFGIEEKALGKRKTLEGKTGEDAELPKKEQLKRKVKEAWGEAVEEPKTDRKNKKNALDKVQNKRKTVGKVMGQVEQLNKKRK